ncbi:aromatic ring-hydroxylating dioxygenase subunit alpha [Arenibacter echinorum]|uniref:Vanillate O-demethylase monooxygenase subunit n=1 Tax=Arenibacter echinorum TaxID=440515 RepID=A0A327RIA3_9FLAO|nr:aromatic ring-hydroxylating dioxygenase subunit alpha [Arenibacter echinorum]RAJ15905.1 vanillate O-demethylase monooxygenase subunit [Arenibacter echinorum]
MQSFTMNESFPLNAWYAVAWDVELKNELLPRTICNKALVLYRKKDGTPVALEDACWHRLLPLSKGSLREDTVVCGYHGLEYNSDGRCSYMPSQETINPSACVRSYPVIQKYRFIWVWMGNPALADETKIPDMHWNDDPDWAGDGQMILVHCNYRLVVDNLMDLTHETFVHSETIGDRNVAEAPFDVHYDENTATVTRWMKNIQPPPFWKGQLNKVFDHDGTVDRWQIIKFEAPCTVNIDVGVAKANTGAPEGNRSQGVNGYVLNTITPSTNQTCLYFWAFSRNYNLKDQSNTTELKNGVAHIFSQDEDILEAQQKAINENPDREFYNLNIDAGAMWARRITDNMVAKEKKD